MTHDHSSHTHAPTFNKAFVISIIANGFFVLFQMVFAYIANSAGLFADAIHNLGDVFSLALAFIASCLGKRSPTIKTTYGLKKTSILAAFANGIFLVFSCGIIVAESVYKFFSPAPVMALSVMVVAGIGIAVNGLTALMFVSGQHDLNVRAAFLHLMSDALVSLAVVISALLLYWTNWLWLDPLIGILIAGVILKGTWALFVDSFRLMIDGVPSHISLNHVRELFESEPGVQDVHDLHIWALSTNENALSVHLLMPGVLLTDDARQRISRQLKEMHHIHHTTIQVEQAMHSCEDICR